MRHGPLSVSRETPQKSWSGKEDSNLRPLPPEDASPRVTPRFSVDVWRIRPAPGGICSLAVRRSGSFRAFGPCLARLTPTQATLCATVFVFTLIGAVALAWAFGRRNGRKANV